MIDLKKSPSQIRVQQDLIERIFAKKFKAKTLFLLATNNKINVTQIYKETNYTYELIKEYLKFLCSIELVNEIKLGKNKKIYRFQIDRPEVKGIRELFISLKNPVEIFKTVVRTRILITLYFHKELRISDISRLSQSSYRIVAKHIEFFKKLSYIEQNGGSYITYSYNEKNENLIRIKNLFELLIKRVQRRL